MPSIPVNTKVGSLQVPLTCTFPIVGKQTVKLSLTGSVANTLAPGQSFYLTDVSSTMEVPTTVVNLVTVLLKATSASGSINQLTINGVNLSPASLNALATPVTVGPVALTKGQTALIAIPASSFLQIGPFTAGSVGSTQLSLGAASGSLQLSGAKGAIGKPLTVSCAAPSPGINLISMTVAGSPTSAVAQPHTGLTTANFNPPLGKQVGVLHYSVSCLVAGLISQTADVTLTGTIGTHFANGDSFNLSNATGQLHLGSDAVNLLLTLFPFATSLSGTLSDFDILASNTTQGTVNAAATTIKMGSATLARNKDATLPIPATGTLTVGPFTTSATATQTDVTIGKTVGTLSPMMSGLPAIPLPVSCDTPSPTVNLVSIGVGT